MPFAHGPGIIVRVVAIALDEYVSIIRHEGDPAKVAVVMPGLRYTVDLPVLHFASEVLRAQGWSVLQIRWSPPDDVSTDEDQTSWVQDVAQRVLQLAHGKQRLIVTKSLSSLAAPVARTNNLPGVWLTPLLGEPLVVDALRTSTQPALLVGGTADRAWDGEKASTTGKDLLELPGASHSLTLAGDPLGSVDLLRTVTTSIWRFVSDLEGRVASEP